MTHALPIVPPAADNELLGSWLERIAAVYDLSAHQLLDRWQVAPGPRAGTMPSVEMRVVAAHAMPLVADRTRTSPQVLWGMIPTVPEWLVASDADVAVCLRCLADDDAAGRPRFRRGGWGICCQVHCSQHRVPLIDMRGWRSRRLLTFT